MNHEGNRFCKLSPGKLLKKKNILQEGEMRIFVAMRVVIIYYSNCSVFNNNKKRDIQRNSKF